MVALDAHGPAGVKRRLQMRDSGGLQGRSLLLVLGFCREALLSNMFTFSRDSVTRCCRAARPLLLPQSSSKEIMTCQSG